MKIDAPRSDAQLDLPWHQEPPPEVSRDGAPDSSLDRTQLDDDTAARARAVDITESFIVRAPAGSGKTELLTQRVLALLAQADTPEEVVAITFTRKAAAEMKDRLLQSLQRAATGDECSLEPHHALTLQLAQQVSVRDRERGWELAANPARLKIQTIDALALWLAQQSPITTRFAAITHVTEHAEPLYAAAAHATISLVDRTEPRDQDTARHMGRLLTHLDNDWLRAHRLLSGMLARRDQWLRHVGHLDRAALEAPMQTECSRQIQRVCEALSAADGEELVALARYAAANLPPDSRLSPCADLDHVPAAAYQRLEMWRGLAALLLTNEGSWRVRFSKSEGFPSFPSAAPFRQRISVLIDRLRSNEVLRQALHGLRELPAPHFTEQQWEVLESIVTLLPRAAAELMLVFGDAGESDFVQLTRAAVEALGDDDAAGDVAHALDSRIRHLLIDEFQDTSLTQFELIERLISNWQPGDGRTVFVVGDPMQSIYRFREAEVGLFLRAWNSGIAPLPLQHLQLARNFRSRPQLVDWANRAFVQVLPTQSDIASGAVAFESSVAADSSAEGHSMAASSSDGAMFHALINGSARDEAARAVDLVRRLSADDPTASVALLVRARPHLTQIVPALREAGLRFTAVELELLLTRPLIGDLLALTRALEHLADSVAWLAVLRAPWCGLTLADLSVLAEGAVHATVWQLVCDPARRAQLSADGEHRLARVAPVFARALELRGRGALAERVRETWWLLGGPACVSNPNDRANAESLFEHLARHEERRHGVPDIAEFEASLARLYAAADTQADDKLQVMTIHKAKGLEFDHVIVPGLDRTTTTDDAQLLQWLERATETGSGELLLSPIYPPDADKQTDSIYCWVERLRQQQQAHEDARLLYVAATRARKQLHWIACIPSVDGEIVPPRENSLLQRLWPAVESECRRSGAASGVDTSGAASAATNVKYDQSLRRLPSEWTAPIAPPSIRWHEQAPTVAESAIEFSWAGETARRVGIVVHRWLQRIAEDALNGWTAERVQALTPHIERELEAEGISGGELKLARIRVSEALAAALSDPRARWLLGQQRDARNELRLTIRSSSGIKRLVVDRTFVSQDGERWIVDYKTGTHEGADIEGFLDRERQRYAGQLELYAQALGGAAHLGLYFPLLSGWREWKSGNGTA